MAKKKLTQFPHPPIKINQTNQFWFVKQTLLITLVQKINPMADIGVRDLVSVAVGGVVGIYIVIQFTPLLVNADPVIVTLVSLFGILIAYAVIRFFL